MDGRGASVRSALGALCLGISFVFPAVAADRCEPAIGRVASSEGPVEVQRTGSAAWQPITIEESLCRGDTIRVGRRGRVAVMLVNDAILRLDENTTLRLINVAAAERERSFLDLVAGTFQSFIRRPRSMAINTPYLNGSIEGTEFVARAESNRSGFIMLEGSLVGVNERGRAQAAANESVFAGPGTAPALATVVRPRDAVQWALYYPPTLAYPGSGPPGAPQLRQAVDLAARRDITGAFAALERVPAGDRDARYHVVRAALSLQVGRVEEARTDIDRALALAPSTGSAYALRAVIGVVQNDGAGATADATRAVALSPREAAAKIALSYAQQAGFQLEAARDTLLQAVAEQPNDVLAWARLAELWLALGERDRAAEAARRATGLAPDLERTQVVLGFAALAEFRTMTAAAAFRRAIALDSADPLPRLGLGLARIRDGELEEGRKEIEIAVGLDSGNALLRAYLGKAYFEEKRGPLDAQQFAISKDLDPKDPTPYLYDAIRKQTENRLGEALKDVQESIDRNDNRAVYRGRQLLDQDRAARGTSAARIYDDLGFHQLGVNEATKSLSLDPANASGHRFLSDTLRGVRRREIARVSELLQAQLLQDININPVQPSLSETNLNIVTSGGPAQAGFNEFTPLFERNRLRLDGTGQIGDDGTWAGEVVASAVYDQFSASLGSFKYVTEGFRPNNDVMNEIHGAYGQWAITSDLNVQVEVRRRATENGDLELNFDRGSFLPDFNRTLDQDTARLGARYSPSPNSSILFSFIRSDRKERRADLQRGAFFGFDVQTDDYVKDLGEQVETQFLYNQGIFSVVAGVGFAHVDRTVTTSSILPDLGGFDVTFGAPRGDRDIDQWRSYVYGNLRFPDRVTWTAGVSADNYNEADLDVSKVNPKVGVRWDVMENLEVHAGLAQAVKPALVANQTLEPTSVAGINQLFDDVNATQSRRYGFGIGWKPTDMVAIGGEATRREMRTPVFLDVVTGAGVVQEDRDEWLHRVYVNLTPLPELATSIEFVWDKFSTDESLTAGLPLRARTMSVPVKAIYFHPSGFFVGGGVTYVDQEVRKADPAAAQGDSKFTVFDALAGFRFPNRIGIASLQVQNLFDRGFQYQDDSFREFQDAPSIGPYIPDRSIMVRLTFGLEPFR
jgi:tetratricopeptide (TPR) repeat protein